MMRLLFIGIFMIISSTAIACTYDGQEYPVGTTVGPLVCMADGTWVEM
jgi:hypothetical protein